jgi:hypothetical protein
VRNLRILGQNLMKKFAGLAGQSRASLHLRYQAQVFHTLRKSVREKGFAYHKPNRRT